MINREMKFCVTQNPHNDLERLARYHIETINDKIRENFLEGIALDCISASIAMAFFNEAVVNYVGLNIFESSWKEKANFSKKIERLSNKLNFVYDKKVEPFRTVEILRLTRNELAHGKPIQFIAVASSNRDLTRKMHLPQVRIDDPGLILLIFSNVIEFKEFLFSKAKVSQSASLSSAIGGG